MEELRILREGWAQRHNEETKLRSDLAIQDKVAQFFDLYQTFAARIEQTEDVFGPQRRAHLAELQRRLSCLAEWQQLPHEHK